MNAEQFLARWQASIEARAGLIFDLHSRNEFSGNHAEIADQLAVRNDLTPIGFNWEMLDPMGDVTDPRSALGILIRAFETDMEYPKQDWFGCERAQQCARDFLDLFDRERATILSNRIEDYWNPLTAAKIEWAFVGFDGECAALLVLTRD